MPAAELVFRPDGQGLGAALMSADVTGDDATPIAKAELLCNLAICIALFPEWNDQRAEIARDFGFNALLHCHLHHFQP